MSIRKVFHLFVSISLLLGGVITPAAATYQPLEYSNNAPEASTHTVCASGCDFTSIQSAIDAASDEDIIDLASETYTQTFTINKSISILGDGAENTIVQSTGDIWSRTRIISITSGITVTIDGLTVRNGYDGSDGGGIYNRGTLTLSNVSVVQNYADRYGGGVFNHGTEDNPAILTVKQSLFSLNGTFGYGFGGSGVNNFADGGLAITSIYSSTFKDNFSESYCGGIANYGKSNGTAIMNIIGSTFFQNSSEGGGGGIGNKADNAEALLTIRNTNFISNTAFYGGAIMHGGKSATLDIDGSAFYNNDVFSEGGGILIVSYEDDVTRTEINNSTISSNSGYYGGGISQFSSGNSTALLSITNSTLSENISTFSGGGVLNWKIDDSTPIITLTNTIIANSTSAADCHNESGTIIDNGYNLIEDGSCLTNPTSLSGDPLLGPLQDNGGPTWTHALLPDSPAIDAIPFGVNGCGTDYPTDQRGEIRPTGAGCDIGSFEAFLYIFLPSLFK